MRRARALMAIWAAFLALAWPGAAAAQIADRCFAVSQAPDLVQPAAMRLAAGE